MATMATEFKYVFEKLSAILRRQVGSLTVAEDSATCYSLAGPAGPAAVKAWGGKMKKPMMPVAWVQIGKAYVSFHAMPFYGNAKLHAEMSKELKARMQGKTCFNFRTVDEKVFKELEQLTVKGFEGFRKAGFIAEIGKPGPK